MPIALVQTTFNFHSSSGGSDTLSRAFSSNTVSGNLLVAVLYAYANGPTSGPGGSISGSISPPATSGISWVLADTNQFTELSTTIGTTYAQQLKIVAIYYAAGAPSISSATPTVFSASASSGQGAINTTATAIVMFEYSGVSPSSPVDSHISSSISNQWQGGVGTTSIVNAGNIITTGTDLIVVGAIVFNSASISAGPGFTALGNIGSPIFGANEQYQLNASPSGSLATAFSVGSLSYDWASVSIAFMPPSGPPSGNAIFSQGNLIGF